MKIDPYYQHTLIEDAEAEDGGGDVALERGRQMRVGWSKMAIFASFARYIF